MSTTILIEGVELLEDTLNEEQRTVGVVLIRPGWSKNGRYYSRAVLEKAFPLYENAFAFADHQSMDAMKRGESRSMKDVTGRYVNVHIGPEGELRATRRVYANAAGNAVWPVIQDAVHNPGKVRAGLSHTAVGSVKKGKADGREGEIVEDITLVHSVDDVVSPAAGGEYMALMADTNNLKNAILESLSYDEWSAARPDHVETLKKQNQRARQTAQERAANLKLEEAQSKIEALTAQLAEQTAATQTAISDAEAAREKASRAEQQIALEKAFRTENLPPDTEKELRQEMEGQSMEACVEILKRAKRLAQAMKEKKTVTGMGQRVFSPPPSPAGINEGPIDMDIFDTPEKLLAEQKRRANARA